MSTKLGRSNLTFSKYVFWGSSCWLKHRLLLTVKHELKVMLQNFDYKMHGGLSIETGHAAIGWIFLVRHFQKCSTTPIEWCQELKLPAFLWGFLKAFCSTSHCISGGQYFLVLVCGEITRRILNELFINWLFINCITMHTHQVLMRGSCL